MDMVWLDHGLEAMPWMARLRLCERGGVMDEAKYERAREWLRNLIAEAIEEAEFRDYQDQLFVGDLP